jgi:hypothetical protein
MPNWCSNVLTLTHTDRKMISRVVKATQKDLLFNEFVPMPKALEDTVEGSFSDPVQQAEHAAKRDYNHKTYGYYSWYDFAVGEWGTKWDASNSGTCSSIEKVADGYSVTVNFDTAWSPPIPFYDKLLTLDFTVDAMYYEPGAAYCGHYYDGQDDSYELNQYTSEEAQSAIPKELDEAFGICEQMAEYETDQDD